MKSKDDEWSLPLNGLFEAVQEIINHQKQLSTIRKPVLPTVRSRPFPTQKTKLSTKELIIIETRVKNEYCDGLDLDPIKSVALNSTDHLIFSGCRGLYNVTPVILAYRNLGHKILEVDLSEEFESGMKLDGNVISCRSKHRGLGDCWSGEDYVWNGKAFEITGSWHTGKCRGMGGGFWTLPYFISHVKKGKK